MRRNGSTQTRCPRASRPSARLAATALLFVLAMGSALADMQLTTPDGRRVLLKDDQTWRYLDDEASAPAQSGAATETAPLILENMKDGPLGCRFGLKLTNELGFEIQSIVPQFTAITAGGVSFDTIFQSFNSLQPTQSQYREVEFRGIGCGSIAEVKVSGGDRCTMGELTKFSSAKGACLAYIRVVASPIMRFSK